MLTSNEARQSAQDLAKAAGQLLAAAGALATFDDQNPNIFLVNAENLAKQAVDTAHAAFVAKATN